MKQYLLLLMFLFSASTFASSESSTEPKPHEQKLIEVVDMYCFMNQDDFSVIDKLALAVDGKELDEKYTAADQAIAHMGGKSFLLKYQDVDFLVGYTIGGGCSVFSQVINNANVLKILTDNYKLRLTDTITEGMQVQKLFEFTNSSLYAGGIVSITHAKEMTSIKSGSIGFIPSRNIKKMTTQSRSTHAKPSTICTLAVEKKVLLRKRLCKGNSEYSSTTGSKCQEEMMQKRINDSAYQIVSGERCGFPSYSNQLNDNLIGTMAVMQVLYDCIEVSANTEVMLERAFAHANRTAPAAGKCPTKLRSRLRVRLPELIRQGKTDISQRESLLRNIGAK